MFRILQTLILAVCVLCLVVLPSTSFAKGKKSGSKKKRLKKQCAGSFNGAADMSDVSGVDVFYVPMQFTADRKGKISGEARRQYFPADNSGVQESVVTISGKIKRAKKTLQGTLTVCKIVMSTSDGSTITGEITKSKAGISTLGATGAVTNGSFQGIAAFSGTK